MSISVKGENLCLRAWRSAFWRLLAEEQNIELTRRTYETQFEGPFRSVTEKDNDGNEG